MSGDGRRLLAAQTRFMVRGRVLDILRAGYNRTYTVPDLLVKLHALASREELTQSLRLLCHEGLVTKVVRGHAGVEAIYRIVLPPDDDAGFPKGAA